MNKPQDRRSLSRWTHVAQDPSRWPALSDDERRELGTSLRDRFFELSARRRGLEDDELFGALIAAIDAEPLARVEGLSISFHPSARFKALRFIDVEHLEESSRALFARPSADVPHLAAVFVDPRELSFRTFENIVPLDRLLSRAPLDITLYERKKLGAVPDRYAFTVEASEATRAALTGLDTLELYVPPLNAVSRGGERFIFHSAALSEALTRAVREAFPKSLLGGFSHVNPVFRCNGFEPGDEKFHAHFDTPYFDAARHHVSRYTLILYLTGGRGAPALRIGEDVELEAIEPMTCVIFDQRHPHEGSAYDDGRKVFLRTELVFEDATVVHEPAVAELFSKACYLTGESVFAPELARYADAYYNRVAEAHWRGFEPSEESEPFLHKQFRGVHFIANGYDFWFAKGSLSLEECAAITLLDYFNCTIGGEAFRSLTTSEVVHERGLSWIPSFLQRCEPCSEPALTELDKRALFPEPEAPGPQCCPFHAFMGFDPSRCEEIIDLYARAQSFAKERILPAPVLMLGEEVFLDRDRFVVQNGAIHVLSAGALAPVNFAACWNYGGSPDNYVDVAASLEALHPLVPPILFTEREGAYHLMFDLFRNSWMVKSSLETVPVPMIRLLDPQEAEESGAAPWLEAVDEAIVKRTGKPAADPWWSDGTPLVHELYGKSEPPR